MYLVEKLGRKILLIVSAIGVIISLCLLSFAFFLINNHSERTILTEKSFDNVKDFNICNKYR